MSKYHTAPYFEKLYADASPWVKRELREAERKPYSFVSVQTVLNGKYGLFKAK